MIPGSANPLLLASAAAAGGYQIERSLRFNSSDSAFCARTPAVAGNRKTWTWAGWVKRSVISLSGANNSMFSAASASSGSSDYCDLRFEGDSIQFDLDTSSTVRRQLTTVAVFRDPAAWYHVVCAMDSDNATAASRLRIWVNNQEQTLSTTLDSGVQGPINNTVAHRIGGRVDGSDIYFSGYLADIHFIDGQALTPSSFTEVSATTGQLIPLAYSGSFGTNGFWLKFSDNSTAAALGTDTSGNGNTWTVNNIAPSDGTTYSNNISLSSGSYTSGREPAKGFDGLLTTACQGGTNGASITLSSLVGLTVSTSIEFYSSFGTPGDNTFTINGSASATMAATNQWTSVSFTGTIASAVISSSAQNPTFSAIRIDGVILVDGAAGDSLVDTPTSFGTDTGVGNEVRGNYCTMNPLLTTGSACTFSNGNLETAVSNIGSQRAWGTLGVSSGKWYFEYTQTSGSYAQGIGIKSTLDADNNNNYAYTGYDGTKINASGSAIAYGATWGINDVIGVAFDLDNATITFYKNGASQGTAFTGINSGTYFPYFLGWSGGSGVNFTMNFGQRAFAYTAPSGFKALCDTNLGAPLVAKPNTLMDVKLFSGNGSTQSITGFAFSPDFAWFKRRSSAFSHELFDVIRGGSNVLFSDLTSAEANNAALVTSFNSDGVSVGSALGANGSGVTSVMWAWDAGTSTVSNTDGSITSQVRANASAGFSVVTYTGTGANATVGHGLGVAPSLFIVKRRDSAANWIVHTTVIDGSYDYLYLNLGNAKADSALSAPTSTIFQVGNGLEMNGSGATYVGYCFAPVVGFSSFGSYVGNGSSDGPFVYTGFRPRWIMFKRTDAVENWTIYDTARDTYNAARTELFAQSSSAESAGSLFVDILSNGFKIRNTNGSFNASSATYIYMAFAENPFQYARAR